MFEVRLHEVRQGLGWVRLGELTGKEARVETEEEEEEEDWVKDERARRDEVEETETINNRKIPSSFITHFFSFKLNWCLSCSITERTCTLCFVCPETDVLLLLWEACVACFYSAQVFSVFSRQECVVFS